MSLNISPTSMTNELLSLPTRPLTISFCVQITLHRLLDKGIWYWQFKWQPYIYPDDNYERGNVILVDIVDHRCVNFLFIICCAGIEI